ncbi:MAG: alpha/beta hydrolase [Acidimicrobiales bacterium]|jgi:alpha-beta hydrolase superfamily lysophospholipase|nr:alpha/beta hydrolase [Acidimicrobiales bacterium]
MVDAPFELAGRGLAVEAWLPETDPTGAIVVAHGMGEHARRYRRLAEALTGAGWAVYAPDHRGHGRTAGSLDALGDLGPEGWDGLVEDLARLVDEVAVRHPGLALVLYGHSMGSFAAQQYVLDHSDRLAGLVLTGTTAVDQIAAALDPTQPADLSVFNAAFEPARTEADWLSRDETEVDRYLADPYCGFGLDGPATAALAAAAPRLGDQDAIDGVREGLPIHLVSGTDDPLAFGGAFVEMVAERYRHAGADVSVVLYEGARHEVVNETNRDEITAELLAWLDRLR